MSNYNGAKKLKKTIKSVLSQSFDDFKFIIIDDCSTDESIDIIKSFQDDRILLVQNDRNLGLTKNLIKGVKLSNSKYIARIDVGDYWDKYKLQQQVEFLEKNKDYVICGTQVYYFKDNNILNTSWFSVEDENIRKRFKTREGVFEHSSILFRNIINYREQFKYSQDLDLYLRISFLGKLYCINKPLTYCEINLDGITLKKKYLQRQYQKWAYKLYEERMKKGKDSLETGELSNLLVRDTFFDKILNRFSMIFYKKYIFNRTLRKNFIFWGIPLIISLIIYPPYMLDYLYKLKGKVVEKK